MSTSLQIEDTVLVFNDMPDNFEFSRGNSFGVTLIYACKKKALDIFTKLCENGQVFVPLTDIPEQGCYGMLADQFDIVWTVKA